ncbi:MAG TPA: hypothetical protein VLV76_05175, partial [Candidatus Acidoferrum sp.]|nr:hypothetical protein [Candidatus Acidoferrum sp.]
KSKRTGKPCRSPAVSGCSVCRMHGAGGGAPCGERNGNYKHGERTLARTAERKAILALLRRARATLGTFALLAVSFLVLTSSNAEAQISLSDVLKKCEQKTIVYGRDENGALVKVGEAMDGYCQGVLEGIFAILVRARKICVKDGQHASSDFLLSTVLTYRAEAKTQDDDAAGAIEAAFKRAFSCAEAAPQP